MSRNSFKRTAVTLALALAALGPAQAALITSGFTYSVADDFGGAIGVGTHFHSNTGGAFGNPAGKAEVGGFFGTEEVRGLSEYNLAGVAAAGPAFVSFEVFLAGGLFGQAGGPFLIDIYAYKGDNLETLSDFEAASTAFIGSFNTAGLAAGDMLSFDVNSALDAALALGDSSFGIRLQQSGGRNPNAPTYTFDNFRLTTDNQCTGAGCQVPEPGSLALVALALLGVGLARRHG